MKIALIGNGAIAKLVTKFCAMRPELNIVGAIGLPAEGIGVIFAVDRVLDMCRTAVNVYGDACGTVVVARLEGETGVLQARPD